MIRKTMRNLIASVGLVCLIGCETQTVQEGTAKDAASNQQVKLEQPPRASAQAYEQAYEPTCENKEIIYTSDKEINAIRQRFIETHYRQIAREQEQKFHLERYQIPKYVYKKINSDSWDSDSASYDPKTGSLSFFFSNGIKKNPNSQQLFESYNCMGNTREDIMAGTDYNIRHELGHAYFYATAEKRGRKELFGVGIIDYNKRENVSVLMVVEGFADYMALRGTPYEHEKEITPVCTDEQMKTVPLDYAHQYDYDVYECGFTLLAPILDKDFGRGLEYIIEHPLNQVDILDLVTWRTNALEAL